MCFFLSWGQTVNKKVTRGRHFMITSCRNQSRQVFIVILWTINEIRIHIRGEQSNQTPVAIINTFTTICCPGIIKKLTPAVWGEPVLKSIHKTKFKMFSNAKAKPPNLPSVLMNFSLLQARGKIEPKNGILFRNQILPFFFWLLLPLCQCWMTWWRFIHARLSLIWQPSHHSLFYECVGWSSWSRF